MKNTKIKVMAEFNGKNLSCGFIKGRVYTLIITANTIGSVTAVDAKAPKTHCVIYGNVVLFLKNWYRVCP